jgi:hypothetical protein
MRMLASQQQQFLWSELKLHEVLRLTGLDSHEASASLRGRLALFKGDNKGRVSRKSAALGSGKRKISRLRSLTHCEQIHNAFSHVTAVRGIIASRAPAKSRQDFSR